MFPENFDINDDIKSKIDEYNQLTIDCKKNIRETSNQFEDFITEYIKIMTFSNVEKQIEYSIDENINNDEVKEISQQEQESNTEKSTHEIKDNRVLLISETQKKVFLPYKVSEINGYLEKC